MGKIKWQLTSKQEIREYNSSVTNSSKFKEKISVNSKFYK
jgi:hypothetical protein